MLVQLRMCIFPHCHSVKIKEVYHCTQREFEDFFKTAIVPKVQIQEIPKEMPDQSTFIEPIPNAPIRSMTDKEGGYL